MPALIDDLQRSDSHKPNKSVPGTPFIYFIRFLRLVIGGFLIIGTSQLAVDSQKEFEVRAIEAATYYKQVAIDGIPTISSDHVDLEYEGKFVRIQGLLDTGTVTDPLTGITFHAGQATDLALRRTVEMLQWQEERKGPQKTAVSRFFTIWSERLINSDNFIERDLIKGQVHNNPKQLPHETGIWFESGRLMLGAWPLQRNYTDGLTGVGGTLFEVVDTVADGWQVSSPDTTQHPYVTPIDQTTEVGAFRISYSRRTAVAGQYSAVGLVEDGVLHRPIFGMYFFDLPLLAMGDVSADVFVEKALAVLDESYVRPRTWIFYVFVGWLLCIGVLARFFPPFESFTKAPFPRRAVLTVIIAAIGTTLVGTIL
jgi:hypothetical protein